MRFFDRLDNLNGWERLWLIASIVGAALTFFILLGEPAIYDSTNLVGDEAAAWLIEQKAEWGWRCIPGTWEEQMFPFPVRFECYSIGVDGLPALGGALLFLLGCAGALKVAHWVAKGFAAG